MPIIGKSDKIIEDATEKDAFVVSFTNGALEQLNSLKDFYKQSDLTELIKLGVSFLQRVKESRDDETEKKNSNS